MPNPKKTVSLRLTDDEIAAVDAYAAAQQINRSQAIEALIAQAQEAPSVDELNERLAALDGIQAQLEALDARLDALADAQKPAAIAASEVKALDGPVDDGTSGAGPDDRFYWIGVGRQQAKRETGGDGSVAIVAALATAIVMLAIATVLQVIAIV